jgi:hypothetical protein
VRGSSSRPPCHELRYDRVERLSCSRLYATMWCRPPGKRGGPITHAGKRHHRRRLGIATRCANNPDKTPGPGTGGRWAVADLGGHSDVASRSPVTT